MPDPGEASKIRPKRQISLAYIINICRPWQMAYVKCRAAPFLRHSRLILGALVAAALAYYKADGRALKAEGCAYAVLKVTLVGKME